VAHLPGEQLVPLLGHLAASHIKKHAEHQPLVQTRVVAKPACRNPPDHFTQHDAKVYFIGTDDRPGCGEGGTDAVSVGGVDVRREVFESDCIALGYPPVGEPLLI
jgi:hypothetical protein